MRLLALCGSLRAASSNLAALQAARLLAPPGVEVLLYRELHALPHFNPDLDGEERPQRPAPVLELRRLVGRSDGLLISCPEYAHGVPGSLKNALDWLVSSHEFPGKPVALINTAPRAVHAPAALAEILTTMSARLVAEASVTLDLSGKPFDAEDIAAHPQLGGALRAALAALLRVAGETLPS